MPVMDGYEATRIMRLDHGFTGLICGVTGNIIPEDQALFTTAGADAILTKPADKNVIVGLLHKHSQRGIDDQKKKKKEEEL